LAEVISTDQSAFIPTRYILDNILLLQETISWAKESKQDAILLKLDFKKAYDTVHLPFLFGILETMGIPHSFIHIIKLLFKNAEASVCLNGSDTHSFPVLRGVRQGCPLAPYLFLFVGEALKVAAKKLSEEGEFAGVTFPEGVSEQLISRYANDVNFIIKAEEKYFWRLVLLLDKYGKASGLRIKWNKSLLLASSRSCSTVAQPN